MKIIVLTILGLSVPVPNSARGPGVERVVETATLDQRAKAFLADVDSVQGGEALRKYFSESNAFIYVRTTHTAGGMRVGQWRFPAGEVGTAIDGPLAESFWLNPEGQPIGLLVHQLMIRGSKWVRVPGNRYVPPGANASSATYIQWTFENSEWVISEIADERYQSPPWPSWCC